MGRGGSGDPVDPQVLETHGAPVAQLAERAGAVVATDRRSAPEHRLPAAIDDGDAARACMVEHAHDLDADPGRVGIGGDSVGGHLAASVALRGHERGAPPSPRRSFYVRG